MRHLLSLLIFLCFCDNTFAQSCWFNDTIRTQDEFDAFIDSHSTCDTLYGSLIIHSSEKNPITNVDGLDFLRHIIGTIEIINSEIITLSSLNNLEVGCDINFINNPYLTVLPSFPKLKYMCIYQIFNNPEVHYIPIEAVINTIEVRSSVDSLDVHISSPFQKYPSPSLSIIADSAVISVEILGNNSLYAVIILGKELNIKDLDEVDINVLSLTVKDKIHFGKLTTLNSCRMLYLDKCKKLDNLNFLNDIEDITSLSINDCPNLAWHTTKLRQKKLFNVDISSSGLKSMKGLSEVATIGTLLLHNLNLREVGMTSLKEIDYRLSIHNSNIQRLDILRQIDKDKIDVISLTDLPDFTDCSAICPYISRVNSLNIQNLGCAKDISELNSFCEQLSVTSSLIPPPHTLSPNPSDGTFLFNCEDCGTEATYSIFDLQGHLIKSGNISWNTTLDTELPSGIYLLNLEYSGKVVQEKLVVK